MLEDQLPQATPSIQELEVTDQRVNPPQLSRTNSLKRQTFTGDPALKGQVPNKEYSSLYPDHGGLSTEPTSMQHTRPNSPKAGGIKTPQTGPTARFYRILKDKNINIKDMRKGTLGYISHGTSHSTKQDELRLKRLYQTQGTENSKPEVEKEQTAIQVRRDRILSSSIKLSKLKIIEQKEREMEEEQKKSRITRRQQAVKGILAGQKSLKNEFNIPMFTERQSEDDKRRVQENKKKYFYDTMNGSLEVHKFSEYAQEVLYMDIMKYMLTKSECPEERLPLLDQAKFASKEPHLQKVGQKIVSDCTNLQSQRSVSQPTHNSNPSRLSHPSEPLYPRKPPPSSEHQHLSSLLSHPQHGSLRPRPPSPTLPVLPPPSRGESVSSRGSRESSMSGGEHTLSQQYLLLRRLQDAPGHTRVRKEAMQRVLGVLAKIH